MFGIYSNQRLTENERKILDRHPDDYNWYCVILGAAFKEDRFFQVREDIEIPQAQDDDGVILMFEGGDVVYFKTEKEDISDEKYQSIINVCSFLKNKFGSSIDAYVLCSHNVEWNLQQKKGGSGIRIVFSSFASDDGEEIIERLEAKLDRNEQFTTKDSIDHMILPFSGYNNREEFQKKFKRYMKKVDECAALMNVNL